MLNRKIIYIVAATPTVYFYSCFHPSLRSFHPATSGEQCFIIPPSNATQRFNAGNGVKYCVQWKWRADGPGHEENWVLFLTLPLTPLGKSCISLCLSSHSVKWEQLLFIRCVMVTPRGPSHGPGSDCTRCCSDTEQKSMSISIGGSLGQELSHTACMYST